MSLTARQQRFVDEYLVDLNATQAAIRAGYAKPNQQGPRLLVNVGVRAAINRALSDHADQLDLTVLSITTRLLTIADKAEKLETAPGMSVARASLMDAAKLNGLVVDSSEVITRSPEERFARLAVLRAERERLTRTH